jgi:hypothetical protein
LAGASAWEKVGALAALLWVVFIVAMAWFLIRRYRRGFAVAITTDGLIVHLPGFREDLMPWNDIGGASIKPLGKGGAKTNAQVARVEFKRGNKTVEIGGMANVFPKREDVEQFVNAVNQRVEAARDETQ